MKMLKRVVVTGGGSGLGRELCLAVARRGGRLLVADIQGDRADETCREAMAAGAASATAYLCDVAKAEDVERLAAEAERAFGGIDLAVNNAGVAAVGRIGEQRLADWRWIVDVNLMGVVHGCHVFVPRLRKQGFGHVLNIGSMAGFLSPPALAAYSATKAAVISLSESLSGELQGSGVGVSVACPMFFQTRLVEGGRFADPALKALGAELFAASRQSAGDIAKACLSAVERGQLYVLPSLEGRLLWRFKRLLPRAFTWTAPYGLRLRARFAKSSEASRLASGI